MPQIGHKFSTFGLEHAQPFLISVSALKNWEKNSWKNLSHFKSRQSRLDKIHKTFFLFEYCKVSNTNPSWLKAHPGIYRLFMKGKLGIYSNYLYEYLSFWKTIKTFSKNKPGCRNLGNKRMSNFLRIVSAEAILFEFGLMYCDLWSIKVRKLFKGGNYSTAETIRGNTVPLWKTKKNF